LFQFRIFIDGISNHGEIFSAWFRKKTWIN